MYTRARHMIQMGRRFNVPGVALRDSFFSENYFLSHRGAARKQSPRFYFQNILLFPESFSSGARQPDAYRNEAPRLQNVFPKGRSLSAAPVSRRAVPDLVPYHFAPFICYYSAGNSGCLSAFGQGVLKFCFFILLHSIFIWIGNLLFSQRHDLK